VHASNWAKEEVEGKAASGSTGKAGVTGMVVLTHSQVRRKIVTWNPTRLSPAELHERVEDEYREIIWGS